MGRERYARRPAKPTSNRLQTRKQELEELQAMRAELQALKKAAGRER